MGIHKINFKSPEQIPPELTCSLCNHIFLQPYQILCKHDHVFCKACLDKYLDFCTREQQQRQSSYQPQQPSSSHGHRHGHGRGTRGASNRTSLPPTPIQKSFSVECPECKKSPEVMSGTEEMEILRVSSFRPAKFVERMVQAQSVHCPTTMTMWCHWSGPLKDTMEHLQSCNFAFEHTCAYRYLGCSFKGGAMDVVDHVKHCTLQPSQPSYSTNTSSSNRAHTPSDTSHQQHPNLPQSSVGTRRQFGTTSRGQGPMSPPQSSPPLPMVPPPVPHPYHRPMAQRAGAHPGYHLGHHYHHQQQHHQQPPLYFHTPVVPPSVPLVPTPALHPIATVVGEPFERAGSYDVSQDFEQLSIDELQRALDAELEDGIDDDDLALYSPNATATARMDSGTGGGDEEFVQVERTNSLGDMEISDLAMSPNAARNSTPPETQEAITQQSSQERAQEVVQEVVQPTDEAGPQQAIYTQESALLISPIITQQIQQEALMIQCGQRIEQETQETPQMTQQDIAQETAQEEALQEKQQRIEETPQVQNAQEIPVSDLPTLSPQMRHRLSPSPSRDHPSPENDLPPAQRRRIIVDEEESDRGSGDMVVDGDYVEDVRFLADKKGESIVSAAVTTATTHVDKLPRRSITYTRQGPLENSSRILRDITDAWVAPHDGRPLVSNHQRSIIPPHSPAGRSSTSPSSARPSLGSSLGLAVEVFRVLNQNQFHQPHQQQDQQSSRRRSSESGQRSPSGKSSVSSKRSSGRFNPLPMRTVSLVPPAAITASSPLMQSSPTGSPVNETPLASPPASSSDDETEPAGQAQHQQQHQQHQLLNPELANFLALTQNPPAHLITEPEPQAFVPFVAYKPRYLKSRRKKGKAGRTYGLPIVRDKDAHDRYQNLMPPILTPDITSPEDSIASQADCHHDN
ncbi:hypothetical protein BG015_002246 [Linnemannia schmuckeri]|uniref:Uncharacterized protein n=1 Tax=Linnemannia schmuckeri TaxID=64567 RepID=A0A9P5RRA1_9FUNG|nr:hypothetical protein BG015_002246 [Linnemannia schmuckeri]